MVNEPVDLDERRDIQEQKSIEIRRRLEEFQDDMIIVKRHQSELENLLLATPAKTWSEAATKALYLLEQFAGTTEAQNSRHQELIAQTIIDLDRLRSRPQEKP